MNRLGMVVCALGGVAVLLAGLTVLGPGAANAQVLKRLTSATVQANATGDPEAVGTRDGAVLICADAGGATAYCGGSNVTASTGTTICLSGCDWRCWAPSVMAGQVYCLTSSGTATLRVTSGEAR